jgi:hypothetical protein
MTRLSDRLTRLERHRRPAAETETPISDEDAAARVDQLIGEGGLWRDGHGWHGRTALAEGLAALLTTAAKRQEKARNDKKK